MLRDDLCVKEKLLVLCTAVEDGTIVDLGHNFVEIMLKGDLSLDQLCKN